MIARFQLKLCRLEDHLKPRIVFKPEDSDGSGRLMANGALTSKSLNFKSKSLRNIKERESRFIS